MPETARMPSFRPVFHTERNSAIHGRARCENILFIEFSLIFPYTFELLPRVVTSIIKIEGGSAR